MVLLRSLAFLADAAATVYAQLPNHTFFTNPVGEGIIYIGGSSQVFSWQHACTFGDSTSKRPAKTEVHFINATDFFRPVFLQKLLTIDCRKSEGKVKWTVPKKWADGKTLYDLKINLAPNGVHSGAFRIRKPKVKSHTHSL
ncbi:hypothetical protein BGX34_000710 [Mortierella sp. NVP85]|nr:hypothetical protein BGX34_000710 [Mortierella sp. NVP85]